MDATGGRPETAFPLFPFRALPVPAHLRRAARDSRAEAFGSPARGGMERIRIGIVSDFNADAAHTTEKTRFFRSLSAGRRCAAASHFAFFKGKML